MDITTIDKNIKEISNLIDKLDNKSNLHIVKVAQNIKVSDDDKFLDIPLMEMSNKYSNIPKLSEQKRVL
jgi:hypothetical protein